MNQFYPIEALIFIWDFLVFPQYIIIQYFQLGVRKNVGKKPPRKLPPPPRKITPRKYAPQENYPPENCPPRKIVLLDLCCF